MKTIQFLSILIASFVYTFAYGAGFTGGNAYISTNIHGEITVYCTEGSQRDTAYHQCWDNILAPGEYTRFQGIMDTRAKKIELAATHEDGSQRIKNESYDGKNGISSRINLWISSLTQRPLLDMGSNTILYKILDATNSVLDHGEFSVQVTRGAPKQCYRRSYWSSSMLDCRFPEDFCSRYFRDENYCE